MANPLNLQLQVEECKTIGEMKGRKLIALARFVYNEDYRDPEPPPLDDITIKKIFFAPKEELSDEEGLEDSISKKVLLSKTELREQFKQALKGTYRTVKSVADAYKRRKDLLENLPKRSPREIRRTTLPPSVYLLMELEEEGFKFSRDTLEKFMDLDDKLIELFESREQSKLARQPLRKNKYYLIILSEALKLVEVYTRYGRKKEIYSLYMYLGKFFEGLHSSWLWLTYELYKLAVDVVIGYRNDLGFGEAIVRFTLGIFCLNKLHDAEEALPHFQAAYNISFGRAWTTEPLTNNKDEIIHTQSSYMTHIAALTIANSIIDTDPKRATELGFQAFKRVLETGKHPDIEHALQGLARLYQKAKEPETALVVLNTQIKQSQKLNDFKGIINGYFLLGYCYKVMKKYDKAYECILIMDELAVKHKETLLEAMACKFLGEYHLSRDFYVKSEKYFERAIKKYMEVGQINEAYKCAVHCGAVRSACNMATYTQLILGANSPEQLFALIGWKLSEDPALWEKLAALQPKTFFEDRLFRKDRRHRIPLTKQFTVPNHPRIRNSVCNLSDIHMVESAQEFD